MQPGVASSPRFAVCSSWRLTEARSCGAVLSLCPAAGSATPRTTRRPAPSAGGTDGGGAHDAGSCCRNGGSVAGAGTPRGDATSIEVKRRRGATSAPAARASRGQRGAPQNMGTALESSRARGAGASPVRSRATRRPAARTCSVRPVLLPAALCGMAPPRCSAHGSAFSAFAYCCRLAMRADLERGMRSATVDARLFMAVATQRRSTTTRNRIAMLE
ncbi:hypothetical protein BU14_0130s0032 [Porphyra umbilicalis]|uniref:Uncharacterized protein n=1 Tax=Porphyra umbilicalis TaxID=2786 RepID=A0A1X6PAL0_PORUM|nr:hypothetical protein BU14_0130s0032 [Porphyra umbilicalis]|eukprot:OSX77877.1 hypothetical protein BU14_0130s0032 [Porphyra umbilicalis]